MKFIALVPRAPQLTESTWDTWTEAFAVIEGETAESMMARIKDRTGCRPTAVNVVQVQS